MENKYYKPTINEFYVGFEYYWYSNNFYSHELFGKLETLEDLESQILNDNIRVKYLNKEDIKSLGWKIEKVDKLRYKLDFTEVFSRNKWILVHYTSESIFRNKLIIYNNTYTDCIFKGTIKNKSELIKVLKMIGIYGE